MFNKFINDILCWKFNITITVDRRLIPDRLQHFAMYNLFTFIRLQQQLCLKYFRLNEEKKIGMKISFSSEKKNALISLHFPALFTSVKSNLLCYIECVKCYKNNNNYKFSK